MKDDLRPVAVLLLLTLTSCSGGGSSVPGSLSQTVTAPSGSLDMAQSEAIQRPQPLYTPGVNDLLYVANTGNNSITVYHHDQQGNSGPLRVIAGSRTGISGPTQLSEDASGNLYVANSPGYPAPSSLVVFAHGASGNVAPIRKLAGPATGFGSGGTIESMTVDQTTGKIFIAAYDATEPGTVLLRFPPNATGNTAPFAVGPITDEAGITQLASDSSGANILDASASGCCSFSQSGVVTFVKQFPNGAFPTRVHTISSLYTRGVADDPTTKTFLTTTPYGILRFAESTDGTGPSDGYRAKYVPPLISTITSDTCGSQLAVGYLRNIYVTHGKQPTFGCPSDAIYVYKPGASGNATPLRILSGPATKLNLPYGIYEGQ